MKMLTLPRITISAPHRSSGKSTLTIGICAALCSRGLAVQPFKKGPDFIDPMWHEAATGRASHNLDLFMMGVDNVMKSFQRHATGADISVVEGNMGLFDGMDLEGSDSTAGVARILKSPVILVVDCYGMTRGIAPLVQGFERFEPDVNIAGVILNKVKGRRHEAKLRAAIERYCDAKVLGALPEDKEMVIGMRHLGLVPAREDPALLPAINRMRDVVAENVDLDTVLDIARSAAPLAPVTQDVITIPAPVVRIGVAMDRAFTFYYPENLDALRAAGAELVPFSPIDSPSLPEVDALYIGGGFPEAHAGALEKNAPLRAEIKRRVDDGLPAYAECGGLMYLCRGISYKGSRSEMAGVIACEIEMSERPAGHGYVILKPTRQGAWPVFGEEIKAHEFHHSRVTGLSGAVFAFDVVRGKGVDGAHDGISYRNALCAYTHVHALGATEWAKKFVSFIKKVNYRY